MLTPKQKRLVISTYLNGSSSVPGLARKYGVEKQEIREVLTSNGYWLVGIDIDEEDVTNTYVSQSKGGVPVMGNPDEICELFQRWGRV